MQTAAPPVNWLKNEDKWSRKHLDLAGPLAGKPAPVAYSHTKWIEAMPIKHANTTRTVSGPRSIFSRFGVPCTVVSDKGTQFTSEEFATFMEINNITHLQTALYHSQSNGASERAVQTVKDGLRKMKEGNTEDNLMGLGTSQLPTDAAEHQKITIGDAAGLTN